MNIKDKIINHALNISCEIYDVDKISVINNNNRNAKTIKAKRMFMYYLYYYLEVNHNGMKRYFKTLNHATSIHHVKKFKFEVETYKDIKRNFNIFLDKMKAYNIYGGGFYEKRVEIKKLINDLNFLKDEYIK
tara:strand:+ start:1098 stop:1493 length:396 start_codon:yes stop_codon:yes gene_type:complete